MTITNIIIQSYDKDGNSIICDKNFHCLECHQFFPYYEGYAGYVGKPDMSGVEIKKEPR